MEKWEKIEKDDLVKAINMSNVSQTFRKKSC